MRRMLTLLACLAVVGCSRPKYSDNSALVIVPGVGIRDVVAIGMSLDQVRKATGDVSVQDQTDNHCVRIPSLGAVFTVHSLDSAVPSIRFAIDLAKEAKLSSTYEVTPFTGSILDGPTFSTGPVFRAEIVAAYGEPAHHVATAFPSSPGDVDKIMSIGPLLRRGESVSSIETFERGTWETMWYPPIGICFQLWEDCVMYVTIQEPVEQAPQHVPSKTAADGGL